MAKLTRYLQKIFANNSNEVGVFGTGTDKETSKNVETLQSADYENGWSAAIVTNKNYPIWQEMDGVQYGLSYQIKYLEQAGIPEWLSTETYYTNSYCRYGADIYYSLQDDNINHNPALNDGWWTLFGGANTDLSNLTATGKDYVVNLANELDWDNAISVSTSTGTRTYTPTIDGVMLLSAFSSGGNASKDVYAYFTLPSGHQVGNQILGTNQAIYNTTYLYVKNNTQIKYTLGLGNSSGTLHNEVKAIFIPFKKS